MKKGTRRPGWPGSTPARPDGSRTARSGCSSPTRARPGHALIDRELHLPRIVDRRSGPVPRRRHRGWGRASRPKPVLAQHMIEPALDAEGAVLLTHRRRSVRAGEVPAGVARGTRCVLCAGHPAQRRRVHPGPAGDMIAAVPPRQWRRISAGDGAPRPRDTPRFGCRSGAPVRPGGALAARPPVPLRSDRDRLHRRRIPAHHAHRTRSRRRIAVAGRGVLPAGQETRPAWSSNRGVPTVHGIHTTLSMLAHIASTARREISRSSPNTDHTCHPGCERLSETTRHTRSDDHPRPHNPFHTTEFTTTTSTNRCIRAW